MIILIMWTTYIFPVMFILILHELHYVALELVFSEKSLQIHLQHHTDYVSHPQQCAGAARSGCAHERSFCCRQVAGLHQFQRRRYVMTLCFFLDFYLGFYCVWLELLLDDI